MDKKRLIRHLREYLTAQLRREPPGERQTGTSDPIVSRSDRSPPTDGGEPDSSKRGQQAMNEDEQPQQQLDQLEQEAQGCVKCRLSENRTQVVFGQGDVSARVMVIGEGPGAREDEQGLPFVGPAGELLRGGFEKVGLSEDQLYITNTVKCRPPQNRDPKTDELDACRPYLDRQLKYIDPPVILTLGNFALQYFLGSDRGITKARGEVYDWEGRKLVPTYHPAYILRNRNEAQSFVDDLQLAAQQIHD